MCTCITFFWTGHLLNTTFIGPMEFGGRQLFVPVIHSAGTDGYLTLLWLVPWHLRTGIMCTCITFCLTRQLSSTTLIVPVIFGGRELFVLVLHSLGPDSYLTHFGLSRIIWRAGVMCTCITFCCTKQSFYYTLIGSFAFGGREFCVLVLHSAEPDSYLALLW
jgi:hypothetical protein